MIALLLIGCRPLPPGVHRPSGCEPAAMRCHEGRAEVCDTRKRWGVFLDCAELGLVCGAEEQGLVTCLEAD